MSRNKLYFVFSTGAVVPNTGDGISEKNISSLAWGSRHRILKARLGTLETCHSVFMRDCAVFMRDCAFHLSSWRVQDSPLPQQDLVWLSQQGHSGVTETKPLGCSGAVSDLAGKRRLILGAVRLVLFVSARGRVMRLLSRSVVTMLRLPLCCGVLWPRHPGCPGVLGTARCSSAEVTSPPD